jgi:hypothetical protein
VKAVEGKSSDAKTRAPIVNRSDIWEGEAFEITGFITSILPCADSPELYLASTVF